MESMNATSQHNEQPSARARASEMDALNQDLVELKRAVIEVRNSTIKTDHQVKNLALDVRAFDKRFDRFESRTRASRAAGLVVVALSVAVAAFVIHTLRVQTLQARLGDIQAGAQSAQTQARERVAEIEEELAALRQRQQARREREAKLAKALDLTAAERYRQAIDTLPREAFAALGPLTRRLAREDYQKARIAAAEQAYEAGQRYLEEGRTEAAFEALRFSIAHDDEGRNTVPARYLLGSELWQMQRFEEAAPVLKRLLEDTDEWEVVDEVTYMLGSALAHSGRGQEAAALFSQALERGTRYHTMSKTYLDAIQSDAELPEPPGS